MKHISAVYALFFLAISAQSQDFYFGADLSYANEMEDCGVVYQKDQQERDLYELFSEYNCNLIRLRLWHSPSWYDDLNNGQRYSDLADVKKAIARAKDQGMDVLLDFHLSDDWADPSKQLVPSAWLPVVDDLDLLKDSLYNYLFGTLAHLHQENLLPEMIQIGNETNKGILLSPEDNQDWTLDWDRNRALFLHALQAVHDFEAQSGQEVQTMIHVAGPQNAQWLIDAFHEQGVREFDLIGISYYWAWHKPTSIEEVGHIIRNLRSQYPNKEVLLVETGYIWTLDQNDNANNLINETHPDYQPIGPSQQRNWLVDLAQEVILSGGKGLVYWEPAWVSSPCYTQWGQGSHKEHAAFFDFDNQLLLPGGIEWMTHPYRLSTSQAEPTLSPDLTVVVDRSARSIVIRQAFGAERELRFVLTRVSGEVIQQMNSRQSVSSIPIGEAPAGIYLLSIYEKSSLLYSQKVFYPGP
ncbi:MAG: glycosyl hydrolase 53 family protein [Bacteroidota bacterium]